MLAFKPSTQEAEIRGTLGQGQGQGHPGLHSEFRQVAIYRKSLS